ncbi:Hypothetical predicted protein [Mytilus galloprovincialis]|uniref:SWIM-type domain-containing protein n=1 Tax=Mytilus galloprovincialis TaxID=29158 RepID=A0A8B6EGR3_MYTGA|nr:Hypothetical predicted protein [Mytilus galloprovincialis]
MANRVLIAGHSQVKYFDQYLKLSNVDVVSFSGYRIEQMWGVIGRRVPDYKIVVLHIGANNLWNDTPADVLTHYQSLVDSIRRVNPSCQILLSGLLPRGQDMFPGKMKSESFLSLVNRKASYLNNKLHNISKSIPRLTYVGHHSFVVDGKLLAKYIVDNNLITLVPSQAAFIVQGRNGKYCVTLFPKETCQCPSTTTCFHILAAKMSIGQEPIEKRPVVSLRVLTKNNRKRVDKKSGKKQPRQNDYDPVVEPAPDSAYLVNTPKTPSQVHSTQKSPQKSALKTKSKTPHSKKKLHFNLETVSEEEIDTCPISPDKKKDNIITLDDTPPGKKRKLDFPSPPISIEIEQEKKQPWIGTLTQVDKKTISDSKCLTSDIVNYAQNILSKQFPLIQGFQNTCYAPVFCNQQKKWLSETSFTPTQAPAVQIHHTGHSHTGSLL